MRGRQIAHALATASILVLLAPYGQALAADKEPFEEFLAADFTRGERLKKGDGAVGLYSHFQRLDKLQSGTDSVDDPASIKFYRALPLVTFDYRNWDHFAFTSIFHTRDHRTSVLAPGGSGSRIEKRIRGAGDLLLAGHWYPWVDKNPKGQRPFLALPNLAFLTALSVDVGKDDPELGTDPTARFRRTSSGSNDLILGAIYGGTVHPKAWVYGAIIGARSLDKTDFGLQNGNGFLTYYGVSVLPTESLQLYSTISYTDESQGKGGDFPDVAANSGRESLVWAVGITANLTDRWGFEFMIQFPLRTDVTGVQPVGNEDLFFGIYRGF